jgi:Las17-binding protein actin regulator
VFPSIVKGGFIIGGQFGDGALRKHGQTVAYYRSVAASYGFQAGVQKFGYALIFMDEASVQYLDKSDGWELGTGPSLVVVDEGFGKSTSTTTLQKGVYAFIFNQKGLMAGAGIQGSTRTRSRQAGLEQGKPYEWCSSNCGMQCTRRKQMRIAVVKQMLGGVLVLMLFGLAPLSGAQEKPADNMQILRDKLHADKKLLVAANMELTESEAQGFWPLYDQYQKDLQKINQRIVNLLEGYAADFRGKSLTDEKAKKLITEAVAIEQAEAQLKSTYAPQLSKVLPVRKVARYLQIENKIRAVVKYDLASGVPLVQ